MPAATGIHWSQAFVQTYGAGLNCQCSKLFFGSPDYPTRTFLVPYIGFGLTDGRNAPRETIIPDTDILIDEAFFIHPDGTEYPILFSGIPSAAVEAATGVAFGLVTLPADLPSWSIYGIRTVWHGEVGHTYIGGYKVQRHRGEKYWAAGDLASVRALAALNDVSTPDRDPEENYNIVANATATQPPAFGPAQIFAKGGYDGRPVACVLSDSLVERQEIAASADPRRNMGIIARWLDKPDPVWGSIPHIFMGLPGAKAQNELQPNALLRWDSFLDVVKNTYNGGKNPWTFVLDQIGRNDNHPDASVWLGFKTSNARRLKTRYGAETRIVAMTIPPTATTSDDRTTVAGYSVTTLWDSVRGTLKAVNDGIKAHPDYAATIDLCIAFASDVDPLKPPAAEMFPLGNVVTHPDNQDEVTLLRTIRLPSAVPLGSDVKIEYQPGTYFNRTLIARDDRGDGTADYGVAQAFPDKVQDGARIWGNAMNNDNNSVIHPLLHGVLWTVGRLPQSEKEKFYT